MFKLKIAPRLMLLFLTVSLLPLLLINFYWSQLSQSTLKNSATSRQTLLTTTAAGRVNQFITDKVNLLIIHSQTDSVQAFDVTQTKQDFSTLINQDKDLESVTLADVSGQEKVEMRRDGQPATLINIAGQDEFRAATFLSGQEYISPVSFTTAGKPYLKIAIPLVKYDSGQILSNLSTAEPGLIRDQSAIKGVLIAQISLDNLWQSVLSGKLGTDGYTYLVDGHGQLIAYPDNKFLAAHRDFSKTPEVATFLRDPYHGGTVTSVISEKGIPVLSTYQPVARTNWAVVAEEPTKSIYSASDHIKRVGMIIFLVVAVLVAVMSYVFSRRITKPIKELVIGAAKISQGNLETRVHFNRNDEISVLGNSFNDMASSLSSLVSRFRAESNKLNVILNNAIEGVMAVDADGVIVVANTALGLLNSKLVKDIVGHKLIEIFEWQKDDKPFHVAFDSPKIYSGLTIVDPKQRTHYVDVLTNPIVNDPNGIKAIVTVIDKTQSRELENMKVDFVSMAAHELRTPLTAIKGYIELIDHDDASNLSEQAQLFLERLKYSASQSVGLINNLLNVAKIERNAFSMSLEKIDWVELVKRAIDDEQVSASLKEINLIYEGPDEGITVLCDRYAITEVINNLISNAIKYTLDNGHVTVRISSADGQVVTEVEDTGIGMPPSAMEHLFTKFYRVNGGLASGSGGTGLGLYISKSIVELHEGIISVTSEEKKGSTFSFSLPAFDESKYAILKAKGQIKESKAHGWATKNITR